MAKPPKSIYGKVHCTTLIKFSKREEDSMMKEYQRTFLARAAKDSHKSGWKTFGRW